MNLGAPGASHLGTWETTGLNRPVGRQSLNLHFNIAFTLARITGLLAVPLIVSGMPLFTV